MGLRLLELLPIGFVVAAWACVSTPPPMIPCLPPPATALAATSTATGPTPQIASADPSAPDPSATATGLSTAAPSSQPPVVAAPPVVASGSASPTSPSVPPAVSTSAAAVAAGACPAEMVLVEGEYCSKVSHTCISHWYDKSNKKKVCEEFKPVSRCVGKRTSKRFCIDRYSWPNVKGERPEVMNNFYQAQVKCAAVGKRMCTESEWTFACEGPDMKPFPHGYKRDAKKCNGDHRYSHPDMEKVRKRNPKELGRLWRGVPSGSQPQCVSDFGVHDLPANNDEVVSGELRKAKFNSVNTGGPWYKGVRNQCRPKIYSHDEGFYYYFLGFRCCSEPDGKPTDPRTPKQRRKRGKFSSVERLAGFGVARTKKALELKKRGLCKCPATGEAVGVLPRSRIMCKTLCGTTLGPGAKNGDDSTRWKSGKR